MAKNKLEQVNQSYKKALGQILLKEFPEIIQLSVSDVLIDPSYQNGRVWLLTDPETVKLVEARRSLIQASIKKYVKTRYTPKLSFIADDRYLDKIDELYSKIDSPNQ